jgi:hypothetical protein
MSLILNKNILAGEVVQDAINNGELLKAPSQNSVFDALALKVNSSLVGANSGIAQLDSNGKVPSSQLTVTAFEYLGNYNATTNSPALVDGTGNAGDLYHVSVAGTQDFGAGNITFSIGDKVAYNGSIWQKWDLTESVSSVFSRTGAVVAANGDYTASQITNVPAGNIAAVTVQAALDELDSEKASTGYADALVSDTAYAGSWDGVTGIAPSKNAVYDQMELKLNSSAFTDAAVTGKLITGYVSGAGTVAATDTILQAIQKLNGNQTGSVPSYGKESFALSAGDITNQYVDLLQVVKASSIDFMFSGLIHEEGVSYSVSLTGGAGGKTRVSFLGDLATAGASALIAADRIVIKYVY